MHLSSTYLKMHPYTLVTLNYIFTKDYMHIVFHDYIPQNIRENRIWILITNIKDFFMKILLQFEAHLNDAKIEFFSQCDTRVSEKPGA